MRINFKYKIEINWSPEDEAYLVRVPELPGCVTHGETPEHALQMAHEIIEGFIESLKRRGLPVPKPLAESKFSGKIPLRIEPTLHRDLASRANIEGVSLNKLIESRLKKAI